MKKMLEILVGENCRKLRSQLVCFAMLTYTHWMSLLPSLILKIELPLPNSYTDSLEVEEKPPLLLTTICN